jgi:hypothetical protein
MSFRAVAPYAVPGGPLRVLLSEPSGFFLTCATLVGTHPGLQPNQPITVTVSGTFANGGGCGDEFESRLVRVVLQQAGGPQNLSTGTAFLPDLPVRFKIVP